MTRELRKALIGKTIKDVEVLWNSGDVYIKLVTDKGPIVIGANDLGVWIDKTRKFTFSNKKKEKGFKLPHSKLKNENTILESFNLEIFVNSTFVFKFLFTAHVGLWIIELLEFVRPHVAVPKQDGDASTLWTYERGALTNIVNASITTAYTHTSHGIHSPLI
jgi:hypothetical protein